jgi:hypothetical protein
VDVVDALPDCPSVQAHVGFFALAFVASARVGRAAVAEWGDHIRVGRDLQERDVSALARYVGTCVIHVRISTSAHEKEQNGNRREVASDAWTVHECPSRKIGSEK